MKVVSLIGLTLIAACIGSDQGVDLPTMTLAPDPGPIVLVREASGSEQGGNDLFIPSRPILLNGGVWVLDEGNDQLVRFDSTLTRATTFGRSGEGPGEIEFPQDLVLDDDRLLVAETGNGRLSVFDTSGTFRMTLPSSRPPRYIAISGGAILATVNAGEDYAYHVSHDGVISPYLDIPAAIRRLSRLAPATYLPARPFIAGGSRDHLYVLDPSVVALVTFDALGKMLDTHLLPEPFRSDLLENREEEMRAWGAQAGSFVDTPATKRFSLGADGILLVLLPLPNHWGLLIDPGNWTARALPLPSDPRARSILSAAPDASLYGDRLFVTSGSNLFEFRVEGWS